MNQRLAAALALAAVLAPAAAPPGAAVAQRRRAPSPPPAAPANSKPECVTVRAVPVLGAYGTNHTVVVENGCDVPVHCEVATDVDPTPRYEVLVGPGAEASVATRAESPASAFRPLYTCEPR